MNLSKLATEKK
jgi:hypothetical protein